MEGARSSANRVRKISGIILILSIVFACSTPTYRSLSSAPDYVRIVSGQDVRDIMGGIRLRICVRALEPGALLVNEQEVSSDWLTLADGDVRVQAENPGVVQLQFRLLGLIPFRRVTVEAVESVEVMPGGHSIGVIVDSDGIMVVDHSPVRVGDANQYPARDAGVRVGDIIETINGVPAESKDQLAEAVSEAGHAERPVVLGIRRGHERLDIGLWPEYDVGEGGYRVGLWVRDGTVGVDTLSAYDGDSMRYVALGHEVSDPRTQQPIPVREGQIVAADVSRITEAEKGVPGEKIGTFAASDRALGSIDSNTPLGISGILNYLPDDSQGGPVPVALQHEVETGPASIITVIRGGEIRRFEAEIIRTRPQRVPEQKGLIISITDTELISETGGIIQGMSGSPIIQNGRLVGAVTHVFVNDPTRGYGVHAEWLARELGLLQDDAAHEQVAPLRGIAAIASR